MNFRKIPLVRQVLGALGGAAIALLLYEGYTLVSPPLQAMLFKGNASSDAAQFTDEARNDRLDRIAQVARDNLAQLQAN